ncbi:MAG: AAA domain-containing protein, partial [bacterium]|nr:AAA domain-containing protein [bacterium]
MTNQASESEFASRIEVFQADYSKITTELGKVIVGHKSVIEEVMICLLAGGHALLEGVPGLGKTLMVKTLAQALDIKFNRIQFTPDLMPADITGTNIVVGDDHGGKQFEFQPGPIFANLVLADEINRATPKTQSAVLEAMGEQTVTVSRKTHQLPSPFMVLATQNPLEMEGTYPLPEAQLDRFMLKILLAAPPVDELVNILDRTTGIETPAAQALATG